jgi:RHS repeat-associated protein
VGAVTDTYEYDAYGNSFTKSGATPNNYLYRGEQFDPDLGLYYLRARYYNPGSGRFYSRDPENGHQTNPQSLHKYLYVGGDPVNGIDPMGREEFVECAEAAVAGGCLPLPSSVVFETAMAPAEAEAEGMAAEAALEGEEVVQEVGTEVEQMTEEEGELAEEVKDDCLEAFGMHEPEDDFITNAVTNEHHMVARFHDLAAQTRYLLQDTDFAINSAMNLVTLPFTFHLQMGLHNPTYFQKVEDLINNALMEEGNQMENVESALTGLSIELQECAEKY